MPRGRHKNHARGERHYRWNRGKMVDDQGYVKMRVGLDHPLADPNGYAFEHAFVRSTGTPEIRSVREVLPPASPSAGRP